MAYWGPRQTIKSAFGASADTLKRQKRVKKVANNTFLWTDENGNRHLRLHHTDILYEKEGKVYVDSGGYRTVTTKARINDWLGKFGIQAQVSQANGVWFMHYKGVTVPYWDGMCLPDDLGNPRPEAHTREVAARKGNLKLAKGCIKPANDITRGIRDRALDWAGLTETQRLYYPEDRLFKLIKRYLNHTQGLVQ